MLTASPAQITVRPVRSTDPSGPPRRGFESVSRLGRVTIADRTQAG